MSGLLSDSNTLHDMTLSLPSFFPCFDGLSFPTS